jgi:hypothetical protein
LDVLLGEREFEVKVVKAIYYMYTPYTLENYERLGRIYVCGKRPLGRPRHRWEDNIKMDLQEDGGVRGDCMELAQDRDRWRALVGMVRNFRVP